MSDSTTKYNSFTREQVEHNNGIPNNIDVLPLNYEADHMCTSLSDSLVNDNSSRSHIHMTDNHFQHYYNEFLDTNDRSIHDNNNETFNGTTIHSTSQISNNSNSIKHSYNDNHSKTDITSTSK